MDEKREANPRQGADGSQLLELAKYRMPFGKYSGRLLIDLPEPYIVWFSQQGFPQGRLGQLMQAVYEIKVNGLEYLFEPFREKDRDTSHLARNKRP